jgi:hypothetical protein
MGIGGHGSVAWLGCVALLWGCSDPVPRRLAGDDAGDAGVNEPADAAGSAGTRIDLPAGSCPRALTFEAGTPPDAGLNVHMAGTCDPHSQCFFPDSIACDDAGVAWTSFTVCACDGTGTPSASTSVGWLCSTDTWSPSYCTAPVSCPADPLPYASTGDAGVVLPAGPCHNGDDCLVRTREQCGDGTAGTTSGYACGCPYAGLGTWSCDLRWSTLTSCGADAAAIDGGVRDGGDAGTGFIHVEGDGAPYDLADSLLFFNPVACDGDATLSGCLAAHTAPCLSTDVTPGNTGTYADRNGDIWTLTSTDIRPAPGQDSIGGPVAEGTLEATAVRGDAVLHLVFTFQTPFRAVIC